jgi:hypothetical protein
MYYRTFKYFTRPTIRAADREREEAGIADRHAHPNYSKIPKKARLVVKSMYPYKRGLGDGIPQVRCFIMWPEGGMAWTMDITPERYRKLPQFNCENVHVYSL